MIPKSTAARILRVLKITGLVLAATIAVQVGCALIRASSQLAIDWRELAGISAIMVAWSCYQLATVMIWPKKPRESNPHDTASYY